MTLFLEKLDRQLILVLGERNRNWFKTSQTLIEGMLGVHDPGGA